MHGSEQLTLLDRVERLLLGDLHLRIRPPRHLDHHCSRQLGYQSRPSHILFMMVLDSSAKRGISLGPSVLLLVCLRQQLTGRARRPSRPFPSTPGALCLISNSSCPWTKFPSSPKVFGACPKVSSSRQPVHGPTPMSRVPYSSRAIVAKFGECER